MIKNFNQFLNEASEASKHLTPEQIEWCNKHIDGAWSVNAQGEVIARKKNLSFKNKTFEKFPVKFADVKGDFDCHGCTSLTSLEGAPTSVGGDFSCYGCTSLTSQELEIAKDEELLSLWLKSRLPIKDFLEKYRGAITGRKFGL